MHISLEHLLTHETKRNALLRFIFVFAIVVVYFIYVSYHYGARDGLWITVLTWSFFVFCTPVADAGILLDLPIRIVTGMRMVQTEIFVWIFAFFVNVFTLFTYPQLYRETILLSLFYHIITTPIPYWLIIFLSFVGTFLSVFFGDELLDVAFHSERRKYLSHKAKYEFIAFVTVFLLVLALYNFLLSELGIKLF